MRIQKVLLALAMAGGLAACGETSKVPLSSGTGPNPILPPPNKTLLPTLIIATAIGWDDGRMPVAAPGLKVTPFARNLEHPRWIMVLPNGDVLVAETDAPPKPDDNKGIKGYFMKVFQKRAGSGTPSANRITLLRDRDGDGVVDLRTTFISGLNSPFGMTLAGDALYVADTDAVLRFAYTPGATHIDSAGEKVVDLPAGTINHHWTKNILASPDGSKLYVTVGSNSNVAENGILAEEGRAAIWEVDARTGSHRVFASGLRNPNGLAWAPGSRALWTAVNERDELGSDLVPDYITSVRDGGFYGWPYSYYGQHVDDRVKPQRPDLVAKAIVPDYAMGPHVAALGLTFSTGQTLGPQYADGVFVGEHGSWNRDPRSGYEVVFVPFAQGMPNGAPREVLTGFVNSNGQSHGRPVGVAIDKTGALLVADDVGRTVWLVAGGARQLASRAPRPTSPNDSP
jgi:glucose/arabinose dehydrogenase